MARSTLWQTACIALLIVALLTLGTAAAPITVESLFTLESLPNQGLTLAGLATQPDGEASVLRVTWERAESAWFPVWNLTIDSPGGLLRGVGEVQVPQVTLQVGHTYRTTLSFDPDLGLLALLLTDETAGETVVRRGWQTAPSDDAVYAPNLKGVRVDRVVDWYQPVDLRWDQGQALSSGFVVLQSVEPAEQNQVRIHSVGPLSGEFRVLAGSSEAAVTVASGEWSGLQTVLTIPANTLPVGSVPLTLQYVEDGVVWYAETRQIQVGRVNGAVRTTFNRSAQTFDVTLNLVSASHLESVDFRVEARVSRLEWDTKSRQYTYAPAGQWHEEIGDITVPAGQTRVTMQLPAPSDPGSWRVDVSVTAEPEIRVDLLPGTAYASTYQPAQFAEGETVSIAIFPDTQLYSKFHPEIYMRMGEWLSKSMDAERIAFALHVGDVTEDNARDQWQVARDAHSLMDGVVPYVMTVGNHDYAPSGVVADRSTTLINHYWTVDDFPHLVGTMREGRLENAIYELDVAGQAYLIVALEFAPSDEALEWANQVVAAHPAHKVMVVTHTYLHPTTQWMASGRSAETFPLGDNANTTMNDGEDIWHKFVRKHPNIVFVVNGHIHSDAIPYRVSVGDHGNRVLQMLVDFQAGPMGGEGYIVLVTFEDDGSVTARAYSPYLDAHKRGFDPYGNVVPVSILIGQ